MLMKLTIENYKSIERAELNFSKLNLLIGPNGSGKSSVLEAFGLMAGKLVPFTQDEFESVVYRHDGSRRIFIGGEFSEKPFSRITYEAPPYKTTVEGENRSKELLHILTADRRLKRKHSGSSFSKVPTNVQEAIGLFYYACYRTEFKDNIQMIRDFYSRYDLHDVRWVPTERPNEYEIIATTPEGVDVNLADAGAGLAALFPIVVALSFYPEGSTVFIEHPEMHLHPKLQYELAEFLLMVSEKRNHQLIIETHSEHLLYGLLNAVSGKRLKPDELTIYSTRKENGKSVFEKMIVHEDGSLEGNLSDFLEADIDAFLDWLKA